MNGISSNYHISFCGKLVPKSKYSGTPKLQEWQIQQIKEIRERIKIIDGELFKKEAEISNETADSRFLMQLNAELEALEKSKNDALDDIKLIKMGIPVSSWNQRLSSANYVKRFLEPVEEAFNHTFG